MIHRTKDGKIESLKDWSCWTCVRNDEDNYYVVLGIGNKDEEINISFDPEEYEDFRRLMIYTKRELVDKIRAIDRLEEAEAREFEE